MNAKPLYRWLLAPMVLLPALARAQTTGREKVDLLQLMNVEVSTATKTAESLDDAPAVITVITAEDIQRWGYQSVGDALKHVVGFYLTDDHILPNVGVRGGSGGLGAESGVIKVMIDGASVSFRSTSGNWLGVELVPLTSVKQIEIIRGPASALYGADAFLGVVNIITLAPEDIPALDARGLVGLEGSNAGGQMDVTAGLQSGSFDWMIGAAGEVRDREGLRLPSESPTSTVPSYNADQSAAQMLDRRSLVVHTRLGYRVPQRGHFVLTAAASGIDRGGDFAHWAQLTGGTDTQGHAVGTRVALGQFRINGNALVMASEELHLEVQTMYFQGGVLPEDRIEVASDLFWVKRRFHYHGVESSLQLRWMPNPDFNLIVGADAFYEAQHLPPPQRVSKETGEILGNAHLNLPVRSNNLGPFASANWRLIDPYLKLTGGVRYDEHSSYGSQVTGRLGTTSRWTDSLVTKLLYGSAFKAPSPYLRYAEPLRPGDVIGNTELKPQHIDTWEAQVSWAPMQELKASTAVAYSHLRDKAEFTPYGINQTARNIASQDVVSWENQVDARLGPVSGYASVELTKSTRSIGQEGYSATLVGTEGVGYPDWIGRAGVATALPSSGEWPLELNTQAILVGPRSATDASIIENGARFELSPYLLLNASLVASKWFLAPGHETTFAFRGTNLLGANGPDPGFSGFEYPLRGREVFLEVRHAY